PLNHPAQRFGHLGTVKLHPLTLPARAYCDRTRARPPPRKRKSAWPGVAVQPNETVEKL
ncbi:hypothetical protein RCH10_005451, partial [Variovorax sp. GrIS 2.14]